MKAGIVWYYVDDMERALDFYGRTLELPVLRRDPHWSELDAGPVILALHLLKPDKVADRKSARREGTDPEGVGPDAVSVEATAKMSGNGRGATLAFRVERLATLRETLVRKGVEFASEIATVEGRVRTTSLRDPDGNLVELYEPLPVPATA